MWIAELVETCIEQITRVNVKLNAIVHRRFDAARAEAKEVDRLVSMNSDAS
jgi:Asp-tRNA(Asn)/Glu-tRNA(Gln) amidotransferase A subunit family amidase